MRLVPLDNISLGMHVASTIYSSSGQVLLRQGVEVKPHYIKYLKKMGLNCIYIQDSRLGNIEDVEDILTENTRVEAMVNLNNVFNSSGNHNTSRKVLVESELMQTTTGIIDELLNKKEVVLQLYNAKTHNNYLISHSVSVTALSVLLLIKSNYPVAKLKKHAAGFLFMDIGSIKLPEYIFRKEEEGLNNEERELIHKHPGIGYEIFKESSLFTPEAAAIIMQHHERMSGQGYPSGLKGDEISRLARAAAVADVYDALISSRTHRSAMHPYRAIMFMLEQGADYYDTELLHGLISFVAAFPVGTCVKLSNGESGIVTGNTAGYTFNPKVKVLYLGEKKVYHPQPYEINLAENLDVTVTEVLDNE